MQWVSCPFLLGVSLMFLTEIGWSSFLDLKPSCLAILLLRKLVVALESIRTFSLAIKYPDCKMAGIFIKVYWDTYTAFTQSALT